jgi:glycerol uptake facilitator-like aquaporin
MASIGKLSWRKVIHYFLGQYIGAFLAAVVTYLVYREAIIDTFGSDFKTTGVNGTAAIFGTFSNENISIGTTILDQV